MTAGVRGTWLCAPVLRGAWAWCGLALAALVALVVLALPANAGAARPLSLGLSDTLFESDDAGSRAHWLDRADRGANADLVLLYVNWRSVHTSRRRPANPANPADPRYDWSRIDAMVRDADRRGLTVVLNVTKAPRWAQGRNKPKWAKDGTWKPRPGAVRAFAQAIATRYSGRYVDRSSGAVDRRTTDPLIPLPPPDEPAPPPEEPVPPPDEPAPPPDDPRALPSVRHYQAWSEPNLNSRLTPQWRKGRLTGPRIYRRLLNAFYRGIKSVRKQNIVITGGTAPYGGTSPKAKVPARSRPLAFWRSVMCLRNRKRLRRAPCPKPKAQARFNVLAHHPINSFGGPFKRARHPDDVSSPDMGRLRRTLRAAERRRTIKPGGRRQIWATEIWWRSRPPAVKRALPPAKHARYIAESLYLAWKGGASAAVNLRIRDAGKEGGRDAFGRNQTGLYFLDGTAKPALTAFRFPFVARTRKGPWVELWGKAPQRGRVVINSDRSGDWREVTTVNADSNRVFRKVVRMRGSPRLLAAVGGEQSLPYKVR